MSGTASNTLSNTAQARATERADNVSLSSPVSEDSLALIIGLLIFTLALAAIIDIDLIGWVVTTSVWSNFSQALGPSSKLYTTLGSFGALVVTYLALLVTLSAAAAALRSDVKRFAIGVGLMLVLVIATRLFPVT